MRRFVLLLASLTLGACATVVSGTHQEVQVVTTPPGAECRVLSGTDEVARVVAPGTVRLERQELDLAVQCRLAGHRAAGAVIRADSQGMSAGNLIVGGMVGLAIDAASGANNRYEPLVSVVLPPLADGPAAAESWDGLPLHANPGASLHRLPIGSVVSGTPKLGRARVPLPPGDWIVAARDRGETARGSIAYVRAILVQPGSGTVDRAIFLTANLTGVGPWGRPADCASRAIHMAVVVRDDHRIKECWWISHFVRGVPNESSAQQYRELDAFLREKRLRMPTMLTAGLFFTDSAGFLMAIYAVRPGSTGRPDEGGVGWSGSQWHVSRAAQEPRRANLIEWQKTWAETMIPALRGALNGELRDVPALPAPPG